MPNFSDPKNSRKKKLLMDKKMKKKGKYFTDQSIGL